MNRIDLREKLDQSDMVLVGLGEEFDDRARLRRNAEYTGLCGRLKDEGAAWLIPAWRELCSRRMGEGPVNQALERLTGLLEGRNYFVVSVSTSSRIASSPWREARLVMPCGTALRKQCSGGCREVLCQVTEDEQARLQEALERAERGLSLQAEGEALLGVCPECGAPLVLNNIYAENYNEDGYLEQWQTYMKWLQGTPNRRLLVLELGVGMDFPSVIRWPFEKAVFFNQKAFLCRVNERLYQLTEELAGKGCGISQNAIDWAGQL